jgi:uncharacterized protein (DUF2236 family)
MGRLRRTGRATMTTVYGARSRAEASIARIRHMHSKLEGVTASGQPYRASDPELLIWVHATASYGFMQAHEAYAAPMSGEARDRFYKEGRHSAALYGVCGAADVPTSAAEMTALFGLHRERLEPSELLFEFIDSMRAMPLMPPAFAPLQRLLVAAAIELLPAWTRDRLRLSGHGFDSPLQAMLVRKMVRALDRVPLRSGPAVQACRRLGLPDDYLFGSRSANASGTSAASSRAR